MARFSLRTRGSALAVAAVIAAFTSGTAMALPAPPSPPSQKWGPLSGFTAPFFTLRPLTHGTPLERYLVSDDGDVWVIRPAKKGQLLLGSFSTQFKHHLALLRC